MATVTVEAALGFQPLPQPPVIRFIHALAGQVFFPLALTIAVCTSDAWIRMPKQAASNKWLSSLTRITPFVVFAQIVLRTLFRHGALGLGPHLLGAFMAIAFVMGLAFPVISRPEFDALQAAARTFLTIACIQILLGFALFTMEAMEADPEYTILVTMIHTAIATVTLAATATMAVLIRRACLSPKSETVLASFD